MKFVTLGLLCFSILAGENSINNVESVQPDLELNKEIVSPTLSQDPILDNTKNGNNLNLSADTNDQNSLNPQNIEPVAQPVGLNTIYNDEEGNWILKKLWWQEGQNVYNDILKINDGLLPLQLSFLVLQNEAEKQFLQQWQILNLDGQILLTRFSELKNKIFQEKDKKLEMGTDEAQKIARLDRALKNLDELKLDFEDLFFNQTQIDQGFNQVNNELNMCRSYETNSWQILRQIAQTLDDQKARGYYQQIFANYQNVKNISLYLKNEYFFYLKKLAEIQNITFNKIKNSMEQLSVNGFRFDKSETNIIEAAVENDISAEKDQLERQKIQQEKIKKANSKKSFIDRLYAKLNSWFPTFF